MTSFAVQAQALTAGPTLPPQSNTQLSPPRYSRPRCRAGPVYCGATSQAVVEVVRALASAATEDRCRRSHRCDAGCLRGRERTRTKEVDEHEGAAWQIPGAGAGAGWLQAARRDRGHLCFRRDVQRLAARVA